MKKYFGAFFLISFMMVSAPFQKTAAAYTDQITVKADEAWRAALEVVKSYGLHKMDARKKFLETDWVQDTVVRKGKWVFKGIFSKTYERRYRLSVRVTQRDYDSEIEVRGNFQERSKEPNSYLFSWQKVKPDGDDLDVERVVFMRILNRLELARSSQTS